MLKALVFDMDGVIIDSEPIHIDISIAVMRDFDREPVPDEIYEFIGVTNYHMWTVLIERYGIDATVEELLERQKYYMKQRFLEGDLTAVEGITELIKNAKDIGLRIALATSSPRFFAEHILKSVGISRYFDAAVTADEITLSKPDPQIYLKAAMALGVKPEECVALEDASLGIQAAKAAGMKVIAYKNPNSGNQDTRLADFVVSSICDININDLPFTV